MHPWRSALLPTLALAALLVPVIAGATVAPPVKIRWVGPAPDPARAGEPLQGGFEILAGRPGTLADLRIEGAGWQVRRMSLPSHLIMSAREGRRAEFEAVPADPAVPLVVRCTFDGRPVQQTFRFDAASLVEGRTRGRIGFADGGPRAEPAKGAPRGRTQGQTIRFKGRFEYQRPDGVVIGADNIQVRVMDEDDISDEVIWQGTTDMYGDFDVVVEWDDCDISGCDDPDIYVEVITTGAVVDVQTDGVFEPTYSWDTSNQVFNDYTGGFVDFGTMRPGDPAEYGAVAVFNGVRRAHRYVSTRHGMSPAMVDCQWPDDDGSFYSSFFEEMHISADATWLEGTHTHEFGHYLDDMFGNLLDSDYENGFCDNPNPGHCVWCPENLADGWQEGWANWFGSVVNRSYPATYGITAFSLMDGRYTLETPTKCQQDSVAYPGGTTEGYVGALLRDLEDDTQDDHDAGAVDCDIDATQLGDGEIFTVFRDDDPSDIFQFITAFRARYPQHDMDLWSTTRNVAAAFGFPLPAPVVTSPAVPCHASRAGETVVLEAKGNGSLLRYQWRRDGVNLSNGPGISGAQNWKLFVGPLTPALDGSYDCIVTTCDGTLSTTSVATRVSVEAAVAARTPVSWGENGGYQVGDGTASVLREPFAHVGIPDGIAADGGRSTTYILRADGTVMGCGTAGWGELGTLGGPVPTPAAIPGLSDIVKIAAGKYHGLALRRDGKVLAWGYNYGTLGDSTLNSSAVPVVSRVDGCVRDIAASEYTSFAVLADGTVWSWGDNTYGITGRGPDAIYRMPGPVPGLTDCVGISAGASHVLVVKRDGTAWGWGWGGNGILGNGTYDHKSVPTQVSGLTDVRSVCGGYWSSYAITRSGQLYGWGAANYGLLGNGWGQGIYPTPVLIQGVSNPVQVVAASALFAAAVMPDGSVLAWGDNNNGMLGSTTPTYVLTPTPVAGVANVSALGAGYATLHAMGTRVSTTDAPVVELPLALGLRLAPNPSPGATSLAFDLPKASEVSLAVYDIAGRRLRTLASGTHAAGSHRIAWDGRDDAGTPLAAGMFFVRLDTPEGRMVRRLLRVN